VKFFRRETATLTEEQIASYRDQGFLLVSGLIEPRVVNHASDAMLERVSQRQADSSHAFIRHPSIVRCFTRKVCSAAGQIAGAPWPLKAPRTIYTIAVFPQESSWQWPAPHVDHALEKDAQRTFPPAFRVGCLIYLNDVSAHCGATVVWPRSLRQIESLALSDPGQYEYLWAVDRDIQKITLAKPLEILARVGDVLFYHYLCAHAGSPNCGTTVRLALTHKW
jgi:hypothetical protein